MITNHLLHLMYQLEITSKFNPHHQPTLKNNPSPSHQLLKGFWKKFSKGKCLLNKLLKLNPGCLGSWSYIFLKLVIFITKQKFSMAILRVNDLMLKMLQKAMYLDFSDQVKSQNLTPKCKILNVFWTWPEVKGGICSIGFQISKILFFQMALKTCERWS